MATNFLKDGKRLLYGNSSPDETIPAGSLLPFGDLVCVAVNDIAPGTEDVVGLEGVWSNLPCAALAAAAPRGTRVYYDDAAGVLTTEEADNASAGVLAEPALAGATELTVKINV